jgi:hypothetical protein
VGRCWVGREPENVRQFAVMSSQSYSQGQSESPVGLRMVVILDEENHVRYSACLGNYFDNIYRNKKNKRALSEKVEEITLLTYLLTYLLNLAQYFLRS